MQHCEDGSIDVSCREQWSAEGQYGRQDLKQTAQLEKNRQNSARRHGTVGSVRE